MKTKPIRSYSINGLYPFFTLFQVRCFLVLKRLNFIRNRFSKINKMTNIKQRKIRMSLNKLKLDSQWQAYLTFVGCLPIKHRTKKCWATLLINIRKMLECQIVCNPNNLTTAQIIAVLIFSLPFASSVSVQALDNYYITHKRQSPTLPSIDEPELVPVAVKDKPSHIVPTDSAADIIFVADGLGEGNNTPLGREVRLMNWNGVRRCTVLFWRSKCEAANNDTEERLAA